MSTPRNVRPSFVKLHVDGRKESIATGPKRRSGSMSAEFYIRADGQVKLGCRIDLLASDDGKTVYLRVVNEIGAIVLERKVTQ